jgi:hypothetical protein
MKDMVVVKAYFKVLIWHMPGGTEIKHEALTQNSWPPGWELNSHLPE